jgi:4-hydroxy-tetrahydrodipicolinate synthase
MDLPGCGGIYFGSVYQEFWTMTLDERTALFDVVAEEVAGRMPIVAVVSSPSARETVKIAKAAEAAGADFLMAWPPYWGPRSRDSVRRYYHEIAAGISLPLFIYSTTLPEIGFYLDIDLVAQLADEIPAICGVKDGTGNVTSFLTMTLQLGDRLAIATPFEEYWAMARLAYPELAADFLIGASRPIYMQTVKHPYIADVLTLLRTGDHATAFAQFAKVAPLLNAQMAAFRTGLHPISLVKYACGLLGQQGTNVRPGTPTLTSAEEEFVGRLLSGIDLI